MIDWIHGLDVTVLENLYAVRTLYGTYFFIGVSEFGRPYTIGALTVALALFLYLKKMYAYMTGLLLCVGGTGLSVLILKQLTAVPRPALPYPAYIEIGYAFPSGHAAGALAFYGFSIFLAFRFLHVRTFRIALITSLCALIALIAYSRLYLGVHYVSDIVGGIIVGAIFFALGILVVTYKKS